jgi:hypothetical protein
VLVTLFADTFDVGFWQFRNRRLSIRTFAAEALTFIVGSATVTAGLVSAWPLGLILIEALLISLIGRVVSLVIFVLIHRSFPWEPAQQTVIHQLVQLIDAVGLTCRPDSYDVSYAMVSDSGWVYKSRSRRPWREQFGLTIRTAFRQLYVVEFISVVVCHIANVFVGQVWVLLGITMRGRRRAT